MLNALAMLLSLQLFGEALARFGGVPAPGPVIGLGLMLIVLASGAPRPQEAEAFAGTLLGHLSLLFVPAGVGVVQVLDGLAGEGARIAVVIVVSTVATMAATALTFVLVARLTARRSPETRR